MCSARLWPGILSLVLFLPTAGPLFGVDFIRGDANGDGAVSIADVHRITGFLYHGFAAPGCLGSADVDDSGVVDYDDARALWNYLRLGAPAPSSPFPQPGPDITGSGGIDCGSYGGGSPIEDPIARVRVLDAVAPGGASSRVTLRIAISNGRPAAGFSINLRILGAAMGSMRAVDLSGTTQHEQTLDPFLAAHSRRVSGELDGPLHCSLVSSATALPEHTEWIPPGSDVVVVEIEGCLLHGVEAGEYPITIENAEIIDAESGGAIQPALEGGLLTVESRVTGDCSLDGPSGVFTVGGGSAPPGGSAVLPFFVWASGEIEGYSFSLDFDEEVLRGDLVEVVWEKPDGSSYGFQFSQINNQNTVPGSHGVDEGYIIGASVFPSRESIALMPAKTDVLALRFHFAVNPETTASSTEIVFRDGGRRDGNAIESFNVLTVGGDSIDLSLGSSFVLVNGFITIIDDIATFIRGDSNGDRAVNMSDSIATLNFLFLEGNRLHCFDAADFNDDGKVDIADPIASLTHLFDGGSPPAPPFVGEGEDPTPDAMTCLTR